MKHIIFLKYFIVLLFSFIICSCASYKNISYFQNSEEFDGSKGAGHYDVTIKPNDKLTIFVSSGSDNEAVNMFNIWDPANPDFSQKQISAGGGLKIHQYLVDKEGNIDYPIVGKIHVSDMTIPQINSLIYKKISPYLRPETDCIVNTYIENYEITVMGEVNYPNTFLLTRPEVSVLEALAMAGDMTIYGKRDNVKILRELSDGTFEVHELDMRDANILNSPYYYLQQRDIVYVEPNETMVKNSKIGQTTQLWIRGASITISLGTLLFRVLQ